MKKVLYGVLTIQVLVLGGLYLFHHSALSGTTYRIETQPVDPRDLFRGDYVILSYPIAEPDKSLMKPLELKWGDEVYVVLAENPESRFWEVVSVHREQPDHGELVLKAQWKGRQLDYGIRRYYVPEGKGNPEGKITVDIVLNRQGRAMIKQLYSDGEPWY